MAVYKTRYFGDFEADDDQDLIEIETFVKEDGEDKEVSIIIHYSGAYKERMGEIIELLDNYFELHEAAKQYIAENYEDDENIVDFLFKYAGQLGKNEYLKNGSKTFTIDIDRMIGKLEPPTVGFQEYRNGKMAARLSYFGPEDTDLSIISVCPQSRLLCGQNLAFAPVLCQNGTQNAFLRKSVHNVSTLWTDSNY